MADTTRKPLNLDELFGQAKTVSVIYKDRNYEMARLEALDPKQAVRFQKLQLKARELQKINAKDPSDAEAEEVTKAVDEMLSILCATLPLSDPELSFFMKTRILEYYFEEEGKKKADKAALAKLRNQQIGRRSSRR